MTRERFDPEEALRRIAAARGEAPPPEPEVDEEPELDIDQLGARAHGKPYRDHPLGEIAARMFRH